MKKEKYDNFSSPGNEIGMRLLEKIMNDIFRHLISQSLLGHIGSFHFNHMTRGLLIVPINQNVNFRSHKLTLFRF